MGHLCAHHAVGPKDERPRCVGRRERIGDDLRRIESPLALVYTARTRAIPRTPSAPRPDR